MGPARHHIKGILSAFGTLALLVPVLSLASVEDPQGALTKLLKGLQREGPGWSYDLDRSGSDDTSPVLVFRFFGSEAQHVETLSDSSDTGSSTFTALAGRSERIYHGYWAGWDLRGYFGRGIYLLGKKEGRWVEGDTSGDVAQGLGYYLAGQREGAWNFYGVGGLFLRSELYSGGEVKWSFTRPEDCKSFPLCFQWGEELVEIGEGKAAAQWFERALTRSISTEHQVHSHSKLAELYAEMGELDRSAEHCDQILEISPGNAFATTHKEHLAKLRKAAERQPFRLTRN